MMTHVRDDPTVIALVDRARRGEQGAWDEIVERFAPLVWSLCRRHRLSPADTDDVGASVWLRLVEHLDAIRDPAALPGWLATTTRRECLSVLRAKRRHVTYDDERITEEIGPPSDEWLLVHERHIALRTAFAELSERCRQLLTLLFADPPMPYTTITTTLGLPVPSIGPTRQRCIEKLRRSAVMAALLEASTEER
jgi:RNA polymerase sigma factor (sigma-70 family)